MSHGHDEFDWLPNHAIWLSRADLEEVFTALKRLWKGTEPEDINRVHVLDIVDILVTAIEQQSGEEQ